MELVSKNYMTFNEYNLDYLRTIA